MKRQDLQKLLSTKLKAGKLPEKPGVYFFLGPAVIPASDGYVFELGLV